MYCHHPQWTAARPLAQQGGIGQFRTIQTFFSYFDHNPQSIANQASLGGGALMDIGCYPISLSRFLFDAEPRRVMARVEIDPEFNVDRLVPAVIEFDHGTSSFVVGTQLAFYQRMQIVGTAGRVEIEMPFSAPSNQATRIWHQTDAGVQPVRDSGRSVRSGHSPGRARSHAHRGRALEHARDRGHFPLRPLRHAGAGVVACYQV